MNTTTPANDVQLLCDLYVIDHIIFAQDGFAYVPYDDGTWPAQATPSDMIASIRRVVAGLRGGACTRAYLGTQPIDLQTSQRAPAPPKFDDRVWWDRAVTGGFIVGALAWLLAGIGALCRVLGLL